MTVYLDSQKQEDGERGRIERAADALSDRAEGILRAIKGYLRRNARSSGHGRAKRPVKRHRFDSKRGRKCPRRTRQPPTPAG